jgi:hypothetical protein
MDAKKKSKTSTYLLWFFGLAMLGGIGAMSVGEKSQQQQPKTPEQVAVDKQENVDLASVVTFAQLIKSAQKDPDSFKLHSVGLTPKGAVCLEYSGTNSYGARLRNSGVLTRDRKNALTTPDGNKFIDAWNKHCANQSLSDNLSLVNRLLSRQNKS